MFEYLDIIRATPRSVQDIKSYLNNGLRLYFGFGLFFLIQSLLLFVYVVISTKSLFPSILILLFTAVGYLILRKYFLKVNSRKRIYRYGTPINAYIVNHGRQGNLLKSSKDYVVNVQVEDNNALIKIVHSSKTVWTGTPVGSHITGLTYEGKYLFAEEMGLRFRVI